MKIRTVLLSIILILLTLKTNAQTPDERGSIVKTGQQVPDITLTLTDGKVIRMKDLTRLYDPAEFENLKKILANS
jgi:hypothetical protein